MDDLFLQANQSLLSLYQHPLKAESRINLIYQESSDSITCAGQFKFRLAHNQVFVTAQTHTHGNHQGKLPTA